jgi:hypothetical protein
VYSSALDRADGRRHKNVGTAPLEHPARHNREFLVDLGKDARARLEQMEANLVTTDARIEAQHIVHKRGQLAKELGANKAAADHDNRQTTPSLRRVGRRIRTFELFDHVISQHQRIAHRLEREGVR